MKKLAINASNKRYYSEEYIKGWEDGVKAQYEATKDAVEVVRCKDCKHLYEDGECPLRTWFTHTEDDYCSYGKRRERMVKYE